MNNVTTSAITPEPIAPVDFDYAAAERTVIDRAEFARLIRKHRGLSMCVFVPDYLRDEVVRGAAEQCFHVTVPAKQALESLERGNYDACEWAVNAHGDATVHTYLVAPAWLQIQRRRELVAGKIADYERRLARPALLDCKWDAEARVRSEQSLSRDRAELARWDAELAARKAQPLAA
jgi:hypothetical protein